MNEQQAYKLMHRIHKDGGSTFPTDLGIQLEEGGLLRHQATGMTLRQYVAVAAMQGYLANGDHYPMTPEDVAKGAVSYADALLKELGVYDVD